MSFGVSVGDILAVSKLIADIVTSLKDAGGAKSEYQALVRELECLDRTLRWLDTLTISGSSIIPLDSIKFAALNCRQSLQDFLGKIRKYNGSLGVLSTKRSMQATIDKLKWGFEMRNEIARLQSELGVHIGNINMLLATHGSQAMTTASMKAALETSNFQETLQESHKSICSIQQEVQVQTQALISTESTLLGLYQYLSGEIVTSITALLNAAAEISVSTKQIYELLLEARNLVTPIDARWTFFQDPWLVEDALGHRFPVPSEYSIELLDDIIKSRFKRGPGSDQVRVGWYEIFATKDHSYVLTLASRPPPGTMITMAMLLEDQFPGQMRCPVPSCLSQKSDLLPDRTRICRSCNVKITLSEQSPKKCYSLDDPSLRGASVSIAYCKGYENDLSINFAFSKEKFELMISGWRSFRNVRHISSGGDCSEVLSPILIRSLPIIFSAHSNEQAREVALGARKESSDDLLSFECSESSLAEFLHSKSLDMDSW